MSNFFSPLSVTLPADGSVKSFAVSGTMVACVSSTADFKIAFGGGEFIPFGVGRSFQVPKDRLSRIELKSTTGAQIDVIIIVGDGEYTVAALVSIQNAIFTLSAANILSITPAAVVVATGHANQGAVSVVYAGKRSISITNTGTINILVNGTTLLVGNSVSWSVERRQDTLNDITVDATGAGGAAFVAFTS